MQVRHTLALLVAAVSIGLAACSVPQDAQPNSMPARTASPTAAPLVADMGSPESLVQMWLEDNRQQIADALVAEAEARGLPLRAEAGTVRDEVAVNLSVRTDPPTSEDDARYLVPTTLGFRTEYPEPNTGSVLAFSGDLPANFRVDVGQKSASIDRDYMEAELCLSTSARGMVLQTCTTTDDRRKDGQGDRR